MKRMNLRQVPDDVYAVSAEAAAANRQSLNAFVIEQRTDVARVVGVGDQVATSAAPAGSQVSIEDAW